MSYFKGAMRDRKKPSPFSKSNEYKRVLRDDDIEDMKRMPPRQYARRVGVGCSCVLIMLQLFRVYMRRNPPQDLTAGLAGLDRDDMQWDVPCGKRTSPFVKGCSPSACARYVQRGFTSKEEAKDLVALAEFGMQHGGGAGGATIMDLPSGALSHGEQFIDLHQVLAKKNAELPPKLLALYRDLTSRVKDFIMHKYELDHLHPTTPRFFSRMDGAKPAKTQHDEYWHKHVDAHQYPGFEYTALLYLNDQGTDYQGGEFSFVDAKKTETPKDETLTVIKPEAGLLVFFSSGPENVHRVHKVHSGKRYALTISFTCDESKALKDSRWVDA